MAKGCNQSQDFSVVAVETVLKISKLRASLVVQWLRIRLAMQGTRVQSVMREDLTCHRATQPTHYNYRAELQSPCSETREGTALRSPRTATREQPRLTATGERPQAAVKTQHSQEINKHTKILIRKLTYKSADFWVFLKMGIPGSRISASHKETYVPLQTPQSPALLTVSPSPPLSRSLAPVLPWGHLSLPSMGSASSVHPVSSNISWLQRCSPHLAVIILRPHGKRDLTSSPWLPQGPGHGRCIPVFLMGQR